MKGDPIQVVFSASWRGLASKPDCRCSALECLRRRLCLWFEFSCRFVEFGTLFGRYRWIGWIFSCPEREKKEGKSEKHDDDDDDEFGKGGRGKGRLGSFFSVSVWGRERSPRAFFFSFALDLEKLA